MPDLDGCKTLFDKAVASKLEELQKEFGKMQLAILWDDGTNIGVVGNRSHEHIAELLYNVMSQIVNERTDNEDRDNTRDTEPTGD